MIGRREFIKLGAAGLLFAGLDPKNILADSASGPGRASPFFELMTSDEFPFPYDTAVFDAAERIFNPRRSPDDPSQWVTDLNLLLKAGKTLDIKVLVADRREDLGQPREVLSFTGVQNSLDIVLRGYDAPRLHYQVQYREGNGAWKGLMPRSFKLPNVNLGGGGKIQAILLGDNHTFDDADAVIPNAFIPTRISGDFMVDFLRNLRSDPNWSPAEPLSRLKFSFSLIKAIHNILTNEDPDLFINLGDSNGIGAGYKWQKWGLPFENLTENDYDYIAKTLWLRERKVFSGLTPYLPLVYALGNHDGESNWDSARFRGRYWRQNLFPLPTSSTYPEGGHPDGNYYAFSWGGDRENRGGAQFIFLDSTAFSGPQPSKPEEWTLGSEQLAWFENTLSQGDPECSFAFFHHVLGGWPGGSNEADGTYAYGRGPLFTREDYQGLCDPDGVQQVHLTDVAKAHGLRGFFYGHDHVFKAKRLGQGVNQKDLYGIVGGSTKYVGEFGWWQGTYWRRFYGDGFGASPDFFGPSGISRLTIQRTQSRVDYICTSQTPNTNLSSGGIPGALYASTIISNPAPAIRVETTAFSFNTNELNPSPPASQILRIQNGGGQELDFRVRSGQSWITASPESGKSWTRWSDVDVALAVDDLAPGTHTGTITVESPGINSVQVSVHLAIQADPLLPPLNFSGQWYSGRFSSVTRNIITLTWRPNPQSAGVTKYRLYSVDESGTRSLIAEMNSGRLSFPFRNAQRGQTYRFALAAVNRRGREGEAAALVV
jgi:hypothetical protein